MALAHDSPLYARRRRRNAIAIGTPIGILAGTYMAEYGRYARVTQVVRFINDILLSAPSIVVGLFVYEVMVAPMGHFSGVAGGVYFSMSSPATAVAAGDPPAATERTRNAANMSPVLIHASRPLSSAAGRFP